jgi:16S rRNA (adenine1518-N6/adenine1519-N6)-dimethyltransferase
LKEKAKPWLLEPNRTKEVLQKHGFRFQKKFGQNFLLDPHVLDKIIAAADVNEEDFVIEIGPGIGTLTQYLSYHAAKVVAVEIDRNLFPILEETLSDWDNVRVIEGDVMKMDLVRIIQENAEKRPVKVVANLPYYITTPILMKLLEEELPIQSITVMVQTEVAERMEASAGTPEYGALSLAVQYYAIPRIAAYVSPHCFVPRPNVGSSVITLRRRSEEEKIQVNNPELLFRIIRAAFGQRRKTLVNALKNAQTLSFSKEQIERAISECGLPLTVRGEALSLEEFVKLTNQLEADCFDQR